MDWGREELGSLCVGVGVGVAWAWETYLSDHHMTVKCARAMCCFGTLDSVADLHDDGRPKRHVRHKVPVHDIDMQPKQTRHKKCQLAHRNHRSEGESRLPGIAAWVEHLPVCTLPNGVLAGIAERAKVGGKN